MKKTLCILLALALCLMGAALAEVTLTNPWVESTSAEIAEAVGTTFGIPEGTEDVAYSLMTEGNLAEMYFTLDGMEYVARIQPADAVEGVVPFVELPIVAETLSDEGPFVDPTTELAREAVLFCGYELKA